MHDYRQLILKSYQDKRSLNSRYSLRAFARDVSLSPSRLSEVLSGKGDLSPAKAETIAAKLSFNSHMRTYFVRLVEFASSDPEHRETLLKELDRVRTLVDTHLDNQRFESIATWQKVAVWSYLMLPKSDGDCMTIAKALKLNIAEVCDALLQLQAAKLVKNERGKWIPLVTEFTSGDSAPSRAIRQYHDSLSVMGRKSIEQQTFSERHLVSMILPFNSKRLSEAGQRIGEFVRNLKEEFGETAEGDSVYALSLQFYRLSEKEPAKDILQ